MVETKKVDEKRKELERKISIYKKNNKALCDMTALYSYCVVEDKEFDPASYIVLEEVIKDLEDTDVNVPFKAENIEDLFRQDMDHIYAVLRELEDSEYYKELEGQLHESYRTGQTRMYFFGKSSGANKDLENQPYDFIGNLCDSFDDYVSEILCANIEISKKVNILYEIIMHCLKKDNQGTLKRILNPRGAGRNLSRTPCEDKENKINELITAFKAEMDQNHSAKKDLFEVITRTGVHCYYTGEWLSYLQKTKLVDFMDMRFNEEISGEEKEVSLCPQLDVSHLEYFQSFYELEEYRNLPEKIRYNNDIFILENIRVEDIASFMALSNYLTGIDDIKLAAKRVLEYQIECGKVRKDIIEKAKEAIVRKAIHKAKNKQEYAEYCKLAQLFEQLADYEAYKKQQTKEFEERCKAREQEIMELTNARYEFVLRLYNMNESLQEQVPGKRVLKELVYEKTKKEK